MTTYIHQYSCPDTAIVASSNQSNSLELLDRHGDYLYRYALLHLSDSAMAEDAVQETLLAALRAAQEPQHVCFANSFLSERKWLLVILKKKLIEQYRKTYRAPETAGSGEALDEDDLFENEGEWLGHWREDMAPTNWNPRDLVLEGNNLRLTLSRYLSELSPDTAMAFRLREFEGLSAEEICDLRDIPADDLCAKLNQARLQITHLIQTQFFSQSRVIRATLNTANKSPLVKTQASLGNQTTVGRAVRIAP